MRTKFYHNAWDLLDKLRYLRCVVTKCNVFGRHACALHDVFEAIANELLERVDVVCFDKVKDVVLVDWHQVGHVMQ